MAEKKGVGHAYNVDFLNVVFAACSIFLFLSVIWMVWDDYDREWKNTQRQFALLQYQVTQAQYQQAARGVDKGKLGQLQAQQKAAQQKIAANQKVVDDLTAKLADAQIKLDRLTKQSQFTKANYDHDRYDYESARVAKATNAAAKGQHAAEEEKQLAD